MGWHHHDLNFPTTANRLRICQSIFIDQSDQDYNITECNFPPDSMCFILNQMQILAGDGLQTSMTRTERLEHEFHDESELREKYNLIQLVFSTMDGAAR